MKKLTIIFTILLLVLTTSVVFSVSKLIIDGTDILSYESDEWDIYGHSLNGLQVERGDGYVNFVLPRSIDQITAWGLHGFVTFTDATISSVTPSDDFYVLEGGWDNGIYGGGTPYEDEIDWFGDSKRVLSSAKGISNSSELEFWLATNSARDGFTVNLTYGGTCPTMKIEVVDPGEDGRYGEGVYKFDIGSETYSYPATIPLATCLSVNIDIKPGSDPNAFNINDHGVIPVAILGSEVFDVYDIDIPTVKFAGLEVRVTGKAQKEKCAFKDFNSDGYMDLVCQFEDVADDWEAGEEEATLEGYLYDGTYFYGSDSIKVVQEVPE